MEHEGGPAGQDTDGECHGDDQKRQPQSGIPAGAALSTTVMISDLNARTLFLQTWPEKPGMSLSQADAVPQTRQLTAVLRSIELPVRGGQGEAL